MSFILTKQLDEIYKIWMKTLPESSEHKSPENYLKLNQLCGILGKDIINTYGGKQVTIEEKHLICLLCLGRYYDPYDMFLSQTPQDFAEQRRKHE